MSKQKPIDWHDVAVVAFDNENPVIISSVEPHVVFDTVCNLIEEEEEIYDHDYDRESFLEEVRRQIASLEWRLYKTDDAKAVFSSRCAKEPQSSIQPLPGQQSFGFSE